MTLKELRHTEVYNLKCEQIEFGSSAIIVKS